MKKILKPIWFKIPDVIKWVLDAVYVVLYVIINFELPDFKQMRDNTSHAKSDWMFQDGQPVWNETVVWKSPLHMAFGCDPIRIEQTVYENGKPVLYENGKATA